MFDAAHASMARTTGRGVRTRRRAAVIAAATAAMFTGALGASVGIAASPSVAAENHIISGTVVDSTGNPVKVGVGTQYGSTTLSDDQGRFSFPTQTGNWPLAIHFPNSTEPYWPGGLYVVTESMAVSDDTNVGEITLPELDRAEITVTDENGVPLWGAGISGSGVGEAWADWDHDLFQEEGNPVDLRITEAVWQPGQVGPDGVARTYIPRMTEPSKLPPARITAQDGTGGTYLGDTADAAQVDEDSFTVAIDGLTASPPVAPMWAHWGYNNLDERWRAVVSWADYGSGRTTAAVTGWTVTANPGRRNPAPARTYDADPRSFSVPVDDLPSGSWEFSVVAHSLVGDTAPVSGGTFTVSRRPTPVAKPTATLAKAKRGSKVTYKATIAWTPPEALNGATLTGYEVTDLSDKKTITTTVSGPLKAVFKNLTPGTRHAFTVAALTAEGLASATSRPVTVRIPRR